MLPGFLKPHGGSMSQPELKLYWGEWSLCHNIPFSDDASLQHLLLSTRLNK